MEKSFLQSLDTIDGVDIFNAIDRVMKVFDQENFISQKTDQGINITETGELKELKQDIKNITQEVYSIFNKTLRDGGAKRDRSDLELKMSNLRFFLDMLHKEIDMYKRIYQGEYELIEARINATLKSNSQFVSNKDIKDACVRNEMYQKYYFIVNQIDYIMGIIEAIKSYFYLVIKKLGD